MKCEPYPPFRSSHCVKRSAFRVLIIDDDENDRFLLERAFRSVLGDRAIIHAVGSGEIGIQYLAGEEEFGARERYPFPNLLITDLEMPDKDGLAVLAFMAHNPAWSVVPRIVFSASDDPDDIMKSYLVGGTAYHTKPTDADERCATVRAIVEYWRRCEVPPVDENGRLLTSQSHGRTGQRYPAPKGGAGMVRPPE